jgi:hypothetical protein
MSDTSPKDQAALLRNATPPAAHVLTPPRHAWSLWRDGKRTDCELRIQGEWGVVVDLLQDGFSYFAQRVPTYTNAEQLAQHERALLIRDGWRNDAVDH